VLLELYAKNGQKVNSFYGIFTNFTGVAKARCKVFDSDF
jgi:hypothetical protein